MIRAWTCPARLCALLATLALVILSFGVAAPATALTPSVDSEQSQAAHEQNADRKSDSTAASTASTTVTTGGDATAAEEGHETSKSDHSTGKSAKSDEAATSSKLATGADKSQAGSHQTEGTSGTSGDAQQEQPVSNADQNTGGANGQCSDSEPDDGVYCSTRDGSPSGNGQGVGEATGKPCAGCVGRADNKNPPGQMPGPEDNNNGYECDNNNGIGKGKVSSKDGATSAGNPAHTGCVTPPTVAEECPPGSTAPECVEEEECPPGSTAPECVEGEGPPPGGNNPPPGPEGNPPPVIGGVQDFANPRPPTVAGVDQFAGPPPAGVLPATGAASSTTGLMTLGLGLVLTGLAVIGLRRHGMARARR